MSAAHPEIDLRAAEKAIFLLTSWTIDERVGLPERDTFRAGLQALFDIDIADPTDLAAHVVELACIVNGFAFVSARLVAELAEATGRPVEEILSRYRETNEAALIGAWPDSVPAG